MYKNMSVFKSHIKLPEHEIFIFAFQKNNEMKNELYIQMNEIDQIY